MNIPNILVAPDQFLVCSMNIPLTGDNIEIQTPSKFRTIQMEYVTSAGALQHTNAVAKAQK
jgi:hypothetical protein